MDELRPCGKAGDEEKRRTPRGPRFRMAEPGVFFFFLRLDTDCGAMVQYADMKRTIGENGGGTE